MSAFENFIQLELPKRPYLDADVAQETVMVRRGPGPRQLAGVTLAEGQVLSLVGGQLVGVTPSGVGSGIRKYVLTVTTPTTLWIMPHNYNTSNVIVQVFDNDGFVILPHDIQIIDNNNIALKFYSNQSGTARAIFLD
jgi:hypothetical protein